MSAERPLLLIDVDGPLNPYRASRRKVDDHDMPVPYGVHRLNGFRVYLSPEHGRMLLEVAHTTGAELAWATTWMHDANTMIAPLIGLPELSVVDFGWQRKLGGFVPTAHWKFDGVLAHAVGRPLAWLDDDFGSFKAERSWFEAQRGRTPTLLHHVDPAVGITADDLSCVASWLRAPAGAA